MNALRNTNCSSLGNRDEAVVEKDRSKERTWHVFWCDVAGVVA